MAADFAGSCISAPSVYCSAWPTRSAGNGSQTDTQRLDLVDLRRASPLLRFHVIRDGRLLYSHDDETLNRFELDTLHLYRDTAPLRRRHREILHERMDAWS